jgi:hypothetical protein
MPGCHARMPEILHNVLSRCRGLKQSDRFQLLVRGFVERLFVNSSATEHNNGQQYRNDNAEDPLDFHVPSSFTLLH